MVLLSPEETYADGLRLIQARDLHKATRRLTSIDYYTAENRQELEPLVRLALADATFYQGNDLALIDARSLYLDFVTLYGGHPLAPYAQFQAAMCILQQVNHPAKDQTRTFQVIDDMREVERRYPESVYSGAARLMVKVAQNNLAAHELGVGRFYMKHDEHLAAIDRFRSVLTDYPGFPDREAVYFALGQALLQTENQAEARIYLDKLVTDFPDGRYAEQARRALSQANGAVELDMSP